MTKLNSWKISPLVMLLLLLNFFAACGSDDDDDGGTSINDPGTPPSPPQSEEQEPDQGLYKFRLQPLNTNVSGSSEIDGEIRIEGDEVKIEVDAEETPRLVEHRQHIFIGTACPTTAHDANSDGYLDVNESIAVTGLGLIPLDADLSSQSAGGSFPLADITGDYDYEERTSLAQMLADLRADDTDASDGLGKLGPTSDLNLPGRVIVVQGISSLTDLPDSVGTAGNEPAHRTLPIACGSIVRAPSNEETPPPASCPEPKSFSTRLSNNLLISGERCRGGETVEVIVNGETQEFVCRDDQWLFTVDNINTCTPIGCTEVGIPKVIGTLIRDEDSSNPPEQCTFEMVAISPIGEQRREILDDHDVRFTVEGEPVVVPED